MRFKITILDTLRHTFASWHIMEGTGERTLMEIKPVYEALHAFEPQI